MRITGIETRRYSLPLDPPFRPAWDPEPRTSFPETIVIVHTDAGVSGCAGGAPLPDLDPVNSLLVGKSVDDVDGISRILETVDFHGGRNWTVDVAVHDAAARASAVPLWSWLGGERRSLLVYASSGQRLSVDERVERSVQWKESWVRGLKIRFYHEDWRDDLAVVAAVRSAVGADMAVMVDANHGWRMPGDLADPWDLETATACAAALADLDVYWLEEPLPMHRVEDLAALRAGTSVRIAGGEMVRSSAESRRLIEKGALDIIQNDVVLAGGIVGARRIAGWAEDHGVQWSPHTWSTGYGLLANLHAALAFSTAEFLEFPYDPPEWIPERRDFMLPEPIEISPDGTISPPPGPGLGVVPDWDTLEQFRVG